MFQNTAMSAVKQRLTDQQYQDWIKAGLILRHIKEGVEAFVEDEVGKLQHRIINNISTNLPAGVAIPQKNCMCSATQLARNKNWKCPFHGVCSDIYKELISEHRMGRLMLDNSDVSMWTDPTKFWEVAKCFIARGYADKNNAQETDCTGLMGMVANCNAISVKFRNGSNDFLQVTIYILIYFP